MVEENQKEINPSENQGGEKQQQPPASDTLYSQLRSVSPLRDVELPDDEEDEIGIKTQSMTERSDESPKLSDLQSALKVLLPPLMRYLNVIQVSRVFPDTYNALFSLLVKDLLMEDEKLSVGEAIAYVTTALSIAIDGEGRIDIIGLYGRAAETELEKEKTKIGL